MGQNLELADVEPADIEPADIEPAAQVDEPEEILELMEFIEDDVAEMPLDLETVDESKAEDLPEEIVPVEENLSVIEPSIEFEPITNEPEDISNALPQADEVLAEDGCGHRF